MAQLDQFHAGQVIKDYGKIAEVKGMEALPDGARFKVVFDVSKAAEPGGVNRSLDSVARFINMHVASGVSLERIDIAVVVHGKAVFDMVSNELYQTKNHDLNHNTPLIKALSEKGVSFRVCGQSATYYEVTTTDLLPNVKMALSAMTAHALLQQQGYSLNPF